jgi:hypothetical protein
MKTTMKTTTIMIMLKMLSRIGTSDDEKGPEEGLQ